MSSFQIHQDKGCLSSTRLNNRLLYFISLRLPLNSSYFNRALVNHFDILTTRSQPVKKINTSEINDFYDITIIHNLVINSIFKLYI